MIPRTADEIDELVRELRDLKSLGEYIRWINAPEAEEERRYRQALMAAFQVGRLQGVKEMTAVYQGVKNDAFRTGS